MLSRHPSDEDRKTAVAHFKDGGRKRYDAVNDLVWALLNSREFLFRH